MCAQYIIKAKLEHLAKYFGIKIPTDIDFYDERIVPYRLAPVVVMGPRQAELRLMNFSLIPSWSAEPKAKFSTHNARLFSYDEKLKKEIPIYEKPTWRAAFKKRHCLVPMNDFIEPIYKGKFAGNMVDFHQKSKELLVAAGIWEQWVSKKDGEVIDSFAVITNEPIPFVKKIGHERSPIFLDNKISEAWLDSEEKEPAELVKLLNSPPPALELEVTVDRPLAKGWERRIPKD